MYKRQNLSGVRDITLPDGSVVDAARAKYTVDKNGVYNFSVRDYCGNILSYPVEVSNIDLLAPVADYEVMPGDWTNKPVTIRAVSYTHLDVYKRQTQPVLNALRNR